MKVHCTALPDILLFEPTVYSDERGSFMESFNEKHFHQALKDHNQPIPNAFVQDNHSISHKGVIRGLHYQKPPFAQGKLVRVTQGSAFCVPVDIRPQSEHYKKWLGIELNAINHYILWIPEGYAHGFMALEDNTHYHYKTTRFYAKEHEAAIRWNDPGLAIEWPVNGTPILSKKDKQADLL